MKKQQFLLTLMMTIVMMAMSPQKMWADGLVEKTLNLGENTITLSENEEVIYSFTPSESGLYAIYSVSDDGYLNCYNASGTKGYSKSSGISYLLGLSDTYQDFYLKAIVEAETTAKFHLISYVDKSIEYKVYVERVGDANAKLLPEMSSFMINEYKNGEKTNEEYSCELCSLNKTSEGQYTAQLKTTIIPDGTNYVVDEPYGLFCSTYDGNFSYDVTYPTPEHPNSMVVKLTNKNGTSTYNLTIVPSRPIVSYTNANRGKVSVEVNGEIMATTTYFTHFIPVGSNVKITAVPLNKDCTLKKWYSLDYTYARTPLNNTGNSYSFQVTEDLEYVYVVPYFVNSKTMTFENYQPFFTKTTILDKNGNTLNVDEGITKPAQVTLKNELSKGCNVLATFDGWYVEDLDGKRKLLSTEKECTVTLDEDCIIIAQWSQTVDTPLGWASYCDGNSSFNVDGGKAYIAEYVEADGDTPANVKLTSVENIYPIFPVLLRDTDGDNKVTIKYNSYNESYFEDNMLEGNWSPSDINLNSNYTYYGLYNQGEGPVEFRKYTGGTLPLNKAVLKVGKEEGYYAKLSVFIDDEAATTTATEKKVTKSVNDNSVKGFFGRRFMDPRKGMYIKNGKKMMVK